MPYNISYYNGTPLVTVPDGSLNTTSTSIALIGPNTSSFGLALNENFIALLQNFASPTPPPTPAQGQLWFYTVQNILQVYDGQAWLAIPLPFDGNAGTAIVAINNVDSVVVVLSEGVIISAVSHQYFSPANLPASVSIADTTYLFSSRFLNGLLPGITLANDPNGYQFNGNALSANILTNGQNIYVTGSANGVVFFNGSNDVVLTTTLINVFNANVDNTQYYSKVLMSSNGTVIDANSIVASDIVAALGYTPPSQDIIQGDVIGESALIGNVFVTNVNLVNSNVIPGTYNTVTVDYAGRVQSGLMDNSINPVFGIILWYSASIPVNWALCDGSVVSLPSGGTFTTPNLSANYVGTTRYIIRIS
jgi:hypothetical protein